jgi:3-hydroxyisobutyrate dehydrogenase
MSAGATKVAFLGLGAMGLPMAANLVEAGFEVAGFDVRPERSAELAERGGQAAGSPAEAASGASVVAAIPFDAEQVRQALLGPGGAFETLAPDSLVIQMATVGPKAMRTLADEIVRRGYRVVDTPVTGGAAGARAGSLTVIAAGAPADLDAADPILKPMAGQIFRVGTEPGQGQTIKMVNQLLVGTHMAATIEAMALARAVGADLQQVYDLLISGQARSQIFVGKVATMLEDDLQTGGSLRIFTSKDMPLVLDAGREYGVPMVTASAALQTMQLGSSFGLTDPTDAQIVKLLSDPRGLAAELAASDAETSRE